MSLSVLDTIIFLAFIAAVVSTGILKSREEKNAESYFLAGRGLSWWLIGFSLIAANISTEQFVGMSGQAADYVGIAIASYEWMAAITLVVVGFFFLPKFLRTGIYTIPEFLEIRYNATARSLMAAFTMIIYVGVTIAAVIYSGALTIETLFAGSDTAIPINLVTASWMIGIIAAVYVASGGLKACAWADLIQGSALILGGAVISYLAFAALGAAPLAEIAMPAGATADGLSDGSSGWAKFAQINADKLHMVLPMNDQILPWTALVVGLWIPNFYYWGLNQYVSQRALGAKSVAEGQKGIVFAASLKLIIPLIIVFPGIIAFNLYSSSMADAAQADPAMQKSNQEVLAEYEQEKVDPAKAPFVVFEADGGWKEKNTERAAELEQYNGATIEAAKAAGQPTEARKLVGYKYDSAFALLIGKLVPEGTGLQGFILAAILGAVVSSLASMLNSASTIFTMDLFKKYIRPEASQKSLVVVGRVCVGVFVVIGCLISPLLGDPRFGGIFTYIQEFQGYISPGILAVFVFGLAVKRAPRICGAVGLVLNPILYGVLAKWVVPDLAFLDRMALCFGCVLVVLGIITAIRPEQEAIELPKKTDMDMAPSPLAKYVGVGVVVATLSLYAIFF